MANSVSNPRGSGGVSFLGLLTILFIGLKLTDHVDWSWLWVLSPMWLPIAIPFGLAALCLAAVIFVGVGTIAFAATLDLFDRIKK